MILLLDNKDSFVYNLARYVSEIGFRRTVARSDAIAVADIVALAPTAIIISPGPGRPEDAGVSVEVVQRLGCKIPILGVCLGHQCIGAAYGARIERAKRPMHGKAAALDHVGTGVFEGLPNPLNAGRYHSLVIAREGLPETLAITATSPDGEIMAVCHRSERVCGVQFHPESVLTSFGHRLLRNFLG